MQDYPIYKRVMAVGSDPADSTVTIALADDEDRGTRFDLDYPIAVALLGLIQGEVAKLARQLPEAERDRAIVLNAGAIFLSQTDDGEPLVVIEMLGGAPLALHIDAPSLRSFAQEAMLVAQDKPENLQ